MSEPLYRRAALDRMASPERLDTSLALVGRPSWLLLAAFAVAIVCGLTWAIFTTVPVKVGAGGLLINRTGLAEIVAAQQGRIDTLLVAPGDSVRAGQPIATIARTELGRELFDARAKLAGARARYDRLQSFYGGQASREAGADSAHLTTIAESKSALETRARFLQQKTDKMATLVDRGFIRRDELVNVQIQLADTRQQLSTLGENVLRVRIDANQRSNTAGLALLDERRTIDEQQRIVAQLTARLGDEGVIRSPYAGRVTEVKVNAGDVIAPGVALATVSPDAGTLVALLYVPAADGKRIEPGMRAEIMPTTVERAVYGSISGRVISVAPLPSTSEGMRRVLRNDKLVQQLAAGGAPIEVRIALRRDDSTASGYAWSASHGPNLQISAGSIVDGRVVVDRTPVIAWLIPAAGH